MNAFIDVSHDPADDLLSSVSFLAQQRDVFVSPSHNDIDSDLVLRDRRIQCGEPGEVAHCIMRAG